MIALKKDARVRVKIAEPHTWAKGAPDALNGAIGTVIEVKPNYSFSFRPGYLVSFDRPVKSWHTHGAPHTAFHFGVEDLEVLP